MLEAALKRDRIIVAAGLLIISTLSWAYIVYLSRKMNFMESGDAISHMQDWGATDLLLMFIMWAVMMAAMMVPSAAPTVLLFATVNRKKRELHGKFVPTSVFLLGYLAVWSGFSLLATFAQWGLHSAALLSPMMTSNSPLFAGLLLLAAGLYQWTPLKKACLSHCHSPMDFITTEWRDGTKGALMMGLKHGSYCLGCCWSLMTLLFVAGVMNLFWIAVIAIFVLIEKLFTASRLFGHATGVVLIGWGLWMVSGQLG